MVELTKICGVDEAFSLAEEQAEASLKVIEKTQYYDRRFHYWGNIMRMERNTVKSLTFPK